MKKIYMSPEMEVIEINMNQQILAGSVQTTGLDAFYWGEISNSDDDAD